MTREEHLELCKREARVYLDRGDGVSAVTSMMSDLNKHPETRLDPTSQLTRLGLWSAATGDLAACRRFVEGFH